jgi:hypothetical protein
MSERRDAMQEVRYERQSIYLDALAANMEIWLDESWSEIRSAIEHGLSNQYVILPVECVTPAATTPGPATVSEAEVEAERIWNKGHMAANGSYEGLPWSEAVLASERDLALRRIVRGVRSLALIAARTTARAPEPTAAEIEAVLPSFMAEWESMVGSMTPFENRVARSLRAALIAARNSGENVDVS